MTYPIKNPCTCDECGGPLPEGSRKTRIWCNDCKRIHVNELERMNREKRKYQYKPGFKRTRNLMKRLGMDYVELRLKRP